MKLTDFYIGAIFSLTGISADIYVTDGDKVEFNVCDGDKEPTATNILPID